MTSVGNVEEFWTRWKDGQQLVRLLRDGGGRDRRCVGVEVVDPVTQGVRRFGALRDFWLSLGRGGSVSVRAYRGRRRRRVVQEGTLLDLFAVVDTGVSDAGVDAGIKLGIDLVARGHEVRKLMWAGFGHKILRAGYDPEDVLQEVYRGILARNVGKCPWDSRKSSFGHYVHMVINGVLTNYHRKQQSIRSQEEIGMRGVDGGSVDASTRAVAVDPVDSGEHLVRVLVGKLPVGQQASAYAALKVLADGGSRKEAALAAGVSKAQLDAMLAVFKGVLAP